MFKNGLGHLVNNPIVAIALMQFDCYKIGGRMKNLYKHILVKSVNRPFKHWALFAYIECGPEEDNYSYDPNGIICRACFQKTPPSRVHCPGTDGTSRSTNGAACPTCQGTRWMQGKYTSPGKKKGFKMELTLPSGEKKWVVPVWLEYKDALRLSCDPADLVVGDENKLKIFELGSKPAAEQLVAAALTTSAPSKAPTLTEWSETFNTMRYNDGYAFWSWSLGIQVEKLNICHDLSLDLLRFLKPDMPLATKCLNYKCADKPEGEGKCSVCKNVKKYRAESTFDIPNGVIRPFKLIQDGKYAGKRSVYERGDINYAAELRTFYNHTTPVDHLNLVKSASDHW